MNNKVKIKKPFFMLLLAVLLAIFGVVKVYAAGAHPAAIKYVTIKLGGIPKTRSIAIDAAGNVWLGNKYSGTIQEINGRTRRIIKTIFLGKSSKPRALAVDSVGNIWVADKGYGQIQKINGITGRVMATAYLAKDSHPFSLAIGKSGNVWVANHASGTVQKIDAKSLKIIFTVKLSFGNIPAHPKCIISDGSGNIWSADKGDGKIVEINRINGKIVKSLDVSGFDRPNVLAVDKNGNIWVPNIPGASLIEIVSAAKGPEYFPHVYSASSDSYPQWP